MSNPARVGLHYSGERMTLAPRNNNYVNVFASNIIYPLLPPPPAHAPYVIFTRACSVPTLLASGFARDVRDAKRSVSAQLGFREARQSHLSPLHAYCILPEREQNGIYILNDFNSNYRDRLLSLNFLPLMMQLELFDILFFIRCLKNPDTTQKFSIHSFVQFSDCS